MVSNKSETPQPHRSPGVVFVDIDNTLIPGALVFLFAVEAWRHGFLTMGDVVPALFEQRHFRRKGESDERVESVQDRALRLVRNHPVDQFMVVAEATWRNRAHKRVFADVVDTIWSLATDGHEVIVVSASPQALVDVVARELRFHGGIGTQLAEHDGVFTGELNGPLLRGVHKAQAAASYAQERGIDLAQCHAFSDSFADVALLEQVGAPTAVNPDHALHQEAQRRGWPVLWPEGTHRYRRIRSR